jgi:hypothetical protein
MATQHYEVAIKKGRRRVKTYKTLKAALAYYEKHAYGAQYASLLEVHEEGFGRFIRLNSRGY